jgi:hypothetical protein
MTEYTGRQIELLRGSDPVSDEEYNWLERHANDIIPESKSVKPVSQTPPPNFTPGEKFGTTPLNPQGPLTYANEVAKSQEELADKD